ncbi:MAG TPA: DUF3828 domain-containing protein [Rhizomicrobium sp.]|nr:DUF3828 domain-containing protein [Rhizomicrobium sp.]
MPRCFNLTLIALAFSATAAMAAAPPLSAEAFLHGIYAHYEGSDQTTGKGIFLDKPSDIRRYFTEDLARLMIADDVAAEKRGDVPELDGDPFVDAQDWDIKGIAIHIDSETGDHAKATVTFENFKKPDTVHLDLAQTPKGWRISDIVWKEGSLRGLYKKK